MTKQIRKDSVIVFEQRTQYFHKNYHCAVVAILIRTKVTTKVKLNELLKLA